MGAISMRSSDDDVTVDVTTGGRVGVGAGAGVGVTGVGDGVREVAVAVAGLVPDCAH